MKQPMNEFEFHIRRGTTDIMPKHPTRISPSICYTSMDVAAKMGLTNGPSQLLKGGTSVKEPGYLSNCRLLYPG